MKRILKTLICLSLVLVMCLGLSACGEFSGNFKTVATAEEINTTFNKIDNEQVEAKSVDGYTMKATLKGDYTDKQVSGKLDMSIDGKFSTKDGFKAAIKTKTTMDIASGATTGSTETLLDMYFADGTIYNYSKVLGIETKFKMDFGGGLQGAIDDAMDMMQEISGELDFLDLDAAQLEALGANVKVYIDSGDKGTKIKITFDDSEKGENAEYGKGSVIYSFDASNKLIAFQMKYECDGLNVFAEMKPYSGSVKLPSDLDTYKSQF